MVLTHVCTCDLHYKADRTVNKPSSTSRPIRHNPTSPSTPQSQQPSCHPFLAPHPHYKQPVSSTNSVAGHSLPKANTSLIYASALLTTSSSAGTHDAYINGQATPARVCSFPFSPTFRIKYLITLWSSPGVLYSHAGPKCSRDLAIFPGGNGWPAWDSTRQWPLYPACSLFALLPGLPTIRKWRRASKVSSSLRSHHKTEKRSQPFHATSTALCRVTYWPGPGRVRTPSVGSHSLQPFALSGP